VPSGLPSVFFGHSAKSFFAECGHSAKKLFAECFFLTLGKEASLASVFFTLGKENFKAHFEAVN